MRGAMERLPALESAEIQLLLNGPESFTPDGNFILGEAPGLRGYYIAAGFNSGGIAGAGGAGRALAEWIVSGAATMDLTAYDPRRFLPRHADPAFLAARMREAPGLHYAIAWPNREPQTGRDLLRSPLHARLAARGACFGAKMGWERANWLAPAARGPAHGATRSAGRTGSRTRRASTGRRGRRWRCSTRPRSASCCWRGPTPARCWAGWPPTTWRCRWAGPSTRRCSTSAAATRAT